MLLALHIALKCSTTALVTIRCISNTNSHKFFRRFTRNNRYDSPNVGRSQRALSLTQGCQVGSFGAKNQKFGSFEMHRLDHGNPMGNAPWDGTGINCYGMGMGQINMSHGQPYAYPWECHSYGKPVGNVPWDGMERDRHKLLWHGMGQINMSQG